MKMMLGEPQFLSIQGEGMRTGVLSVWTRWFGCSLRCPGFFQKDPTDSSTYIDPLQGIDPKAYKSVFDIPVVAVGCDSIYSIDPRFKHCNYEYNEDTLLDELYGLLPDGKFKNPRTKQTYDWCITGGEPLMNQKAIALLYEKMYERDRFPYDIQIETNCTRPLTEDFTQLIRESGVGRNLGKTNWHFSMSPKLFTVAGEPDEKAWKPENILQYWNTSKQGWLKVVVNGTDASWNELERKVDVLLNMGIEYPIMIMGVGATKEQQEDSKFQGKIANEAIRRGYHVSGRLHTILFGNGIGT